MWRRMSREHDNSFFFLLFGSKSVLKTLRILKLLPHLNSCVSQEEEAGLKEEDEIEIDKKKLSALDLSCTPVVRVRDDNR